MEPRFGHDFSRVQIHSDGRAAESARAVNALAYSVGNQVVFGAGQYSPGTSDGQQLLAHELTHVVQQSGATWDGGALRIGKEHSPEEHQAESNGSSLGGGYSRPATGSRSVILQRRGVPYIKKITVHLTPPQSAEFDWEGTLPSEAVGKNNFTVSTGKGYGDPGDPPGTCTRNCCSDPLTQCAPPWNQPGRTGACCTYYGNNFWTGTPVPEHNGWKWWTPIQPYYSDRGIALHQHTEVTGHPIGHGCVRMQEEYAKLIYDYSNGRRTNVTIDGRAAPVLCDPSRQCGAASGAGADLGQAPGDTSLAMAEEAIPGLEGVMS